MFKWAQQTLANVAGTAEPEYGPEAIKSIAEEAKTTPYTEISNKDNLIWETPETTCVETKTFYLMADSGQIAMLQVIYSNIAGIRITVHFTSKILYRNGEKPHLWASDELLNYEFSEDKNNFYADNLALELSEDGNSYIIKSAVNEGALINITVTTKTPGFVAGKDGKTLYGTDLANPWGSMRHAFWPRCDAEGTITTQDGPVDFKGKAFFVHALQGMKPHHAAARWNFLDFQGSNYSATIMEFITPSSYGSTVVNVGGIVKDGEIIMAGCDNIVDHLTSKNDEENDWPQPVTAKFVWNGKTKDGKAVEATIEGALEERLDRIDIMAEVPGFVKNLVAMAAGTKPYVYQFSPTATPLTLKLKIGDQEIEEKGETFFEASFVS